LRGYCDSREFEKRWWLNNESASMEEEGNVLNAGGVDDESDR
jgi:hypothetical protein